jgi:uncharacterized repeat protein (TIGR03806 family)
MLLRSRLWLLPLCALAVVACSNDKDKHHGHGDGGGQGDGDGSTHHGDGGSHDNMDGGHDMDSSLPSGPFGIAERPKNPTCIAPAKPVESTVGLTRVFENISFSHAVAFVQARGDDGFFYVIEQRTGAIKRFPNKSDVKPEEVQTLVKLSVAAGSGGSETGLLGIALDPKFTENHFLYVALNPSGADLKDEVHRYTVSDDFSSIDKASKLLIYSVRDPYSNHNGGNLVFGPDDFLYYGLGDGGDGGDPHCFSHDPNIPFGKFFRFDVHKKENGKNFGIPPGNPYANGGGLPEIYTIGMRNPWRWSFDRETGDLWAGDVGQNDYEEIDRIELGKNYGWNSMEGTHCYQRDTCKDSDLYPNRTIPPIADCNDPSLTLPVWDYNRDLGNCVVGGYVYRGAEIPSLVGTYLYADYGNGPIYGLTQGDDGKYDSKLLVTANFPISSFGEDNQGRVYVIDWAEDDTTGGIYRIDATNQMATDTLPKKLSATGCVDPHDATKPVEALIPYGVRVPFWSDGAEKARWFAIPDDTQITVGDDGDFELPPGAVAMKEFKLGGKRIETRFYVRWDDGSYGGYTYQWDEDGKDATLLDGALKTQIGDKTWEYPSRGQCTRCHAKSANGHLGIEAIQLNAEFAYTTRRSNQINTLMHIGMLKGTDARKFDGLPLPGDETLPDTTRARAYLQANCAHCHRPGGSGRGVMDMRFSADDPKLCNQAPDTGDLGIAGAKILVPGNADHSLLYQRMSRRDDKGMPPLASAVVDEQGAALLKQWITQLKGCP